MPSLLKPLPGSILDKHCCELSLGQASQYLPPPFLNSTKEIQIYQPKLDGANMAALASSSHLVRWEMCVLPFSFPFLYRLFPIQTFQGDIPWGQRISQPRRKYGEWCCPEKGTARLCFRMTLWTPGMAAEQSHRLPLFYTMAISEKLQEATWWRNIHILNK